MEITGHSTREMFDRYNTIDVEDTRDAMTRLNGFLSNSANQSANQAAEEAPAKEKGSL